MIVEITACLMLLLWVLKKSALLLVLLGRGRSVGFEYALEMALVGKAQIVGKVGDGASCAQTQTCLLYAQVDLIGMG